MQASFGSLYHWRERRREQGRKERNSTVLVHSTVSNIRKNTRKPGPPGGADRGADTRSWTLALALGL